MVNIDKNTSSNIYFNCSTILTGLTSAYTMTLYNQAENVTHTLNLVDISTIPDRARLFNFTLSATTLKQMIYDYTIYNSSSTIPLEKNKIKIYETQVASLVDTQSDDEIKLIDNR